MVEQLCKGLISYSGKRSVIIYSLNQIPKKHQFIVDEIIKKSMTDFQKNITFTIGQITDIENQLPNDSTLQTEDEVRMYDLYFELVDTTIGIKKYCLWISLDQYGQVIYFDWARENYGKRINFIKTEDVLKFATNYARYGTTYAQFGVPEKHKTNSYISKLKYDSQLDKLCWEISFLQTSSDDEYRYVKTYKTIVIDAIELKVLNEYESVSVGTD